MEPGAAARGTPRWGRVRGEQTLRTGPCTAEGKCPQHPPLPGQGPPGTSDWSWQEGLALPKPLTGNNCSTIYRHLTGT